MRLSKLSLTTCVLAGENGCFFCTNSTVKVIEKVRRYRQCDTVVSIQQQGHLCNEQIKLHSTVIVLFLSLSEDANL